MVLTLEIGNKSIINAICTNATNFNEEDNYFSNCLSIVLKTYILYAH
jgi:hypothetical protein